MNTGDFPWMGLQNSHDIFHEKISELIFGFELYRAYIDDLLVVSKDIFENLLENWEEDFTRLTSASLKNNKAKINSVAMN
jgi:hypothetical protein